jgi:hypothetical protein
MRGELPRETSEAMMGIMLAMMGMFVPMSDKLHFTPWTEPRVIEIHMGKGQQSVKAHNTWDRLNFKPTGVAAEIAIVPKKW